MGDYIYVYSNRVKCSLGRLVWGEHYFFKIKMYLLVVASVVIFIISRVLPSQHNFNCWGRLYTHTQSEICFKSSVADIVLSMSSNRQGYMLVKGAWSCKNMQQTQIGGILNFKFEKQGERYSLQMNEHNPRLGSLVSVLRYETLKLKITRVSSYDYILSLPNETLMVCTQK